MTLNQTVAYATAAAMICLSVWAQQPARNRPRPAAQSNQALAKTTELSRQMQTASAAQLPALQADFVQAALTAGRSFDAAREAKLMLQRNPQHPRREQVSRDLIDALIQSRQWDQATSALRAHQRAFPKAKDAPSLWELQWNITRWGQRGRALEEPALADYLEKAPPKDKLTHALLTFRHARLAELTNKFDVAVNQLERAASLLDSIPPHGRHLAYLARGRAVWLYKDRLRQPAQAVKLGKTLLQAPANPDDRQQLSGTARFIADAAREASDPASARELYIKALELDPANREAANRYRELEEAAGSPAQVKACADLLAKLYGPTDPLALDARIALARKQFQDPKADLNALFNALTDLTRHGHRTADVAQLADQASAKLAAADQAAHHKRMIDLYTRITPTLNANPRQDLALRHARLLRDLKQHAAARDLLLAELRANPLDRRDLPRDYLTILLDELEPAKQPVPAFESAVRALREAVVPVAYMPELRVGMDEIVAELQRRRLREQTNILRTEILTLTRQKTTERVELIRREARRNSAQALAEIALLHGESPDLPAIYPILRESVTQIIDRTRRQNDQKPILPFMLAWADAHADDLPLQRYIAEWLRNIENHQDAMRIYARVIAQKPTTRNRREIGLAFGGALDVAAYTLKDRPATETLAKRFEELAPSLDADIRQDRFRQLAEIHALPEFNTARAEHFARLALNAGVEGSAIEPARKLIASQPPERAIELAESLAAKAGLRRMPELLLLAAHRRIFDQADLPAALEQIHLAGLLRLANLDEADDPWGTLPAVAQLVADRANPKRVTDAKRSELIKRLKEPQPAELDRFFDLALAWHGGGNLQRIAANHIELLPPDNAPAQLLVLARVLSRVNANDQWHWEQNNQLARTAIARSQPGTAASMIQMLLEHSPQIAQNERRNARAQLVRLYEQMGEDLLLADQSGPLAPLLRGARYIRLGETRLAFEAYRENPDLALANVEQLPIDFLLFITQELSLGDDTARDAAEQLLRTWLARTQNRPDTDTTARAQVSLQLADVFYLSRRFDVARAEYQTIIDQFPDTPPAIEARFRIGESLMYQRNFPAARQAFDKLLESTDLDISLRATFMIGVLLYNSEERDEARETFKQLLDLSPSEELSSKALFQLAVIYGDDQRFREMLDMLEAIGRLGREGKRWHAPGETLTVVINDPTRSIVRQATAVPVEITTSSGDRETIMLVAGAAGRGLFLAEIPTELGTPRPNDRVLQLLGSDIISYDYTEDFKARFSYVPPPQGNIRIAANARLDAASVAITDQKQTTLAEQAASAAAIVRGEDLRPDFRNAQQFKPGNPIYIRAIDPDRSLTSGIDRVEVEVAAASGDTVRASLIETGPDSAVFQAVVPTADRPPEPIASDALFDSPTWHAADSDPDTAWQSLRDGRTPKHLMLDLKDVLPIASIAFNAPKEGGLPKQWRIERSNNNAIWEPVAASNPAQIAYGLAVPVADPAVYLIPANAEKQPNALPDFIAAWKAAPLPAPARSRMATLSIEPDLITQPSVTLLTTYFHAPAEGRYLFNLTGPAANAALAVNGWVVFNARSEIPQGGAAINLSAGWHRISLFASLKPGQTEPLALTWLPPAAERDKTITPSSALPAAATARAAQPPPSRLVIPNPPEITADANAIALTTTPVDARFIRLVGTELPAGYMAIAESLVRLADQTVVIPAGKSLAQITTDNILHISPGETATISYVDEFNMITPGEPRVLSTRLQATHHNASIQAVAYEIRQTPGGGPIQRIPKQLYRIDPGERIIAIVSDFDEDQTPEKDTVQITVRTDAGDELTLDLLETEPTSGVFTREIETSANAEPGKLRVAPGQRIYLIYQDRLNTDPGARVERIAVLQVAEPANAALAILPTRAVPIPPKADAAPATVQQTAYERVYLPPPPKGQIATVALQTPLTIEVIDPDAAKDSFSTVTVRLTTSAGAGIDVPLELSNACWPHRSSAAGDAPYEGRFVGQVLLNLGTPESVAPQSLAIEAARGLIGAWRYQRADEAGSVKAPMLPILAQDTITAEYLDLRTTSGQPATLTANARMVSDARLESLDKAFQSPVARIHVGQSLHLRVHDPDQDASPDLDTVSVQITSTSGELFTATLTETFTHSGIFQAIIPTTLAATPTPSNNTLEINFADQLTITYRDQSSSLSAEPVDLSLTIDVAVGSDAQLSAFSKKYSSTELAIETEFKLAECYFELFKSHNELSAEAEARAALQAGRSILTSLREHHRDPRYQTRVLYLLASFHLELKEYELALDLFRQITQQYPGSVLAPDAQYKIGQAYELKGDMDQATEEYVRLAYTFPDSPLVADCMIRLSEHFYKSADFPTAADISAQFLENYPEHPLAPTVAFRLGQAHFRRALAIEAEARSPGAAPASARRAGPASAAAVFLLAASAFDRLDEQYPSAELRPEARFWAGQSYHRAGDPRLAYRRYISTTWDFPDSEAAKYARGQLTQPEIVRAAQSERLSD